MTEIMKSDIFFFIASVSVMVLTVVLFGCLLYIFFILRKAKRIVDVIKEESEHIVADMRVLRATLQADSGAIRKVAAVTTFIKGIITSSKKTKKRSKRKAAKRDKPATGA